MKKYVDRWSTEAEGADSENGVVGDRGQIGAKEGGWVFRLPTAKGTGETQQPSRRVNGQAGRGGHSGSDDNNRQETRRTLGALNDGGSEGMRL